MYQLIKLYFRLFLKIIKVYSLFLFYFYIFLNFIYKSTSNKNKPWYYYTNLWSIYR